MIALATLLRAPQRLPAFRALRHRNFRYFWLSGLGHVTAQGMQQLTLVWLVLQHTGSLGQLGLVVSLQGVTMLGSVLFGGVLADRVDRRKILGVGQFIMAATIMIAGVLVLASAIELWHLYIAAGLTGLVQGFTQPARVSFVSRLVDREDIMNAVALNSMIQNTSRILGPSLAGVIVEVFGIGPALFMNSGFYVAGIFGLLFIRGVPQVEQRRAASAIGDLAEGLRYAWRTPLLLAIVLLSVSVGFFGMPYIQLVPAFVRDVLGLGAGEAGLYLGVAGIGSLVGNLALATFSQTGRKNTLMVGLGLLFSAALFAFALTPWLALGLALMFFIGMGSTTLISVTNATIQLTTPPALVGRMMSLLLLTASLMFIGALPMGLVGEWAGLRVALGAGAGMVFVVTLVLGVVWWPIRKADI